MRGLMLTKKEQSRIQVLNGVIAGEVTVEQAAGLMGVSERHAWRLLAAYREKGAAAIAHGNRGRKPTTTTDTSTQSLPSDRDALGTRGGISVTLNGQKDTAVGRRFTPTCVGTARIRYWALARPTVHPHVRGDGATSLVRDGDIFGSPPRAWGRPAW